MHPTWRALASFILIVGAACICGCDQRPEARYYQAPKDRTYAQAAGMREIPAWTTPAGWKVIKTDSPNEAMFEIASAPGAMGTLMQLAGDEFQQTLERWGAALGLDLKTYDQIAPRLTSITVDGNPAFAFDLTSSDGARRILMTALARGQIATQQGPAEVYWCIGLHGPANAVESQKSAYESLVNSFRLKWEPIPDLARPAPTTQPQRADPSVAPVQSDQIAWTLPQGWQPQPTKMMSFANFAVVKADQRAEAAITQMRKEVFEQMMLMNLNRWRGLVGLPPTENPNANVPKPMKIAGRDGSLLDLTGPTPAGGKAQRLLVAWCANGQDLWFFKLQGPADFVAEQQPAFNQFIASIRFAGNAP